MSNIPIPKGSCFQTLEKSILITNQVYFLVVQLQFHCCKIQINFTFDTQRLVITSMRQFDRSKTIICFGSGYGVGARRYENWVNCEVWRTTALTKTWQSVSESEMGRYLGHWTVASRRVAVSVFEHKWNPFLLTIPFVSHFFSRVETRPCLRLWHVLQLLAVQKNLLNCNLW